MGVVALGAVSFWRPIDFAIDQTTVAWVRISCLRGDVQIVFITPNEQSQPAAEESAVAFALDFRLRMQGVSATRMEMFSGANQRMGHPQALYTLRPGMDVVRWPGLAFWTCQAPNISSFDWTNPMSLMFTSPRSRAGRTIRRVALAIPLWPVMVIFAAYPVIAFIRGPVHRRFSRRYRREHGLCIECRYDLTHNVSGVCPECGTEIERDA